MKLISIAGWIWEAKRDSCARLDAAMDACELIPESRSAFGVSIVSKVEYAFSFAF